MRIRIPRDWQLPEAEATPEEIFMSRRALLAAAAGTLMLPSIGCAQEPPKRAKYPRPFERNEKYKPGRALSEENEAIAYNNFYEFSRRKKEVHRLVENFTVHPWQVQVKGHCKRTGTFDLDDILKKLPSEERLYRFRCVERWTMTVPWIGIPMKKFLDWVEPTSKAKFVRFVSFQKPNEAPGQKSGPYKHRFPYYEGLRIDEAANELAMLVTGLYGKQVPKQNGAPIRVIAPWKYGFKSPKSIVRIEFVDKQPHTFWNDEAAREYGFYANVWPKRAHPRWSQATEWNFDRTTKQRKTQPYNGYAEYVAHMYKDDPNKYGY